MTKPIGFSRPQKILSAFTGIVTTLVAVIFSEIGGDIKKFSSVPNAYVEHMSKRGSPCLSRAVWLTADIAAFKDPAVSLSISFSSSSYECYRVNFLT